jgi:hypothetical protein
MPTYNRARTVSRYGAIAGAASWLPLNVVTVIINVQQMHKHTLSAQMSGEYWDGWLGRASPSFYVHARNHQKNIESKPDCS